MTTTLTAADRDRLDAQLKALRVVCPCAECIEGTHPPIGIRASAKCEACDGTGTVARFPNGLADWLTENKVKGLWVDGQAASDGPTITVLTALTIYQQCFGIDYASDTSDHEDIETRWLAWLPNTYGADDAGNPRWDFNASDAATLVQRIGERIAPLDELIKVRYNEERHMRHFYKVRRTTYIRANSSQDAHEIITQLNIDDADGYDKEKITEITWEQFHKLFPEEEKDVG